MRQGRALLPLQIVPETPSVLSAGEHTGWNRSPQSKRAPPAGMPLGVLIRPGRRAGHAIGPSGDRHRHPVVLITRCYCVHPLSFLEPGGRLLYLSGHRSGNKSGENHQLFQGTFPANQKLFQATFISKYQLLEKIFCLESSFPKENARLINKRAFH